MHIWKDIMRYENFIIADHYSSEDILKVILDAYNNNVCSEDVTSYRFAVGKRIFDMLTVKDKSSVPVHIYYSKFIPSDEIRLEHFEVDGIIAEHTDDGSDVAIQEDTEMEEKVESQSMWKIFDIAIMTGNWTSDDIIETCHNMANKIGCVGNTIYRFNVGSLLHTRLIMDDITEDDTCIRFVHEGDIPPNEIWLEYYEADDSKTIPDNSIQPLHYTRLDPQPKDVIRDWGLNFNLGSAVKYISRAGHKDDIIQDLKKAKEFIQFEIDYLEKGVEKMDNAVREIVYNLSENTITLYSHGPQGFERVLSAREIAETIEHFPANAAVVMCTSKRW